MSCTDVQTIQAGNGTKTQFSFDFPYIFKSEIHVYFWNATTKEYDEKLTTDATYPWRITDANPTIVEFTGTAPPAPATPVDPGETTVDNVKIRRITKVDDIRALFNPGSAIRSDDLNKNFEQLRYAIQEANCQGIPDDVDQYLKDYYWDRFDNTLYSADTWRSDDATIATTASLDQRFQDEVNETFTKAELAAASDVMPDNDDAVPTTGAVKDFVDHVVETDILVDGTGLNKTGSGGQVTLGISADSVDFDRIKNADKIQLADQIADYDNAGSNDKVFTSSAAVRRFENYVQTTTPSSSGIGKGAVWVDNDDDLTLSVWDGSAWLGITSGGTFTNQPKVVYVDASSGNDANDGHRISRPKATIKAAINQINLDSDYGDGSVVVVAAGVYQEAAPIQIQKKNVSIVGQALRSCIVHPTPATETNVLFELNSGSFIQNLTLTGMKAGTGTGNTLDPDLPTVQGWNFAFYNGATITKSPYIQNCTNFSDSEIDNSDLNAIDPAGGAGGDTDSAPTGGGMLIDGSAVASDSPLRSMVADSYTHVGLNGPGILVTNNGYCQATSSYAFFNKYHIKCLNGGQANLAASTTDFGAEALVADGKSSTAIFTSNVDGAAADGDISFNINAPVAHSSWHGSATRPQSNMLVEVNGNIYPVLSAVANTDSEGGAGWTVTISRPNANNRSINDGIDGDISDDASVSFYLRSMIASSGHTMEYVGSGTDYSALPENGGVPDDTKQIVESNNGKIWTATTDHNGKFSVGDFFQVDQRTGFVSFSAGSVAFDLATDSTPQLGGDLDTNNFDINLAAGTEGAPSLTFSGDEDTGMYHPAANEVAISTGGTGRLFIDSSGNIGVGTSSPETRLHVAGDDAEIRIQDTSGYSTTHGPALRFRGKGPNGTVYTFGEIEGVSSGDNNAGELRFLTNSAGVLGQKMVIKKDGKVGIGLLSPTGYIHIEGESTGTETYGRFTTGPANGDQSLVIKSGSSRDHMAIQVKTNAGAVDDLSLQPDGGNVGIGTSSPQTIAHVYGENPILRIQDDSTAAADAFAGIQLAESGAGGSLNNYWQIALEGDSGTSTDHLTFKDQTSERMRIDSSGNVLIGKTSNSLSGQSSSVQSNSVVATHGPLTSHTTSAGIFEYNTNKVSIRSYGATAGTGTISFRVGGGGGAADSEAMRIDSSGNVGIGTSSPARRLEVRASASGELVCAKFSNAQDDGASDSVSISLGLTRTGGYTFDACKIQAIKENAFTGTPSTINSALAFITTNSETRAERMRIDSSGNVGIGTTSPSQLLHVAGASAQALVAASSGTGTIRLTRGTTAFEAYASTSACYVGTTSNTDFQLRANNAERVRIDSSGRLLVGASSSSANTRLIVAGNSGTPTAAADFRLQRGSANPSSGVGLGAIYFTDSNENIGAGVLAQAESAWAASDYPTRLVFSTTADGASSPTERMRITQKGCLNVAAEDGSFGGSNATARFSSISAASANYANQQVIVVHNKGTSGTRYMMSFGDSASYTERGFITWDGTNVDLVNASDQRLKTNILEASSTLESVKQIQVRSFDWTENGNHVDYGFIAQELDQVAPEAVNVGIDDEDGNIDKPWAVGYASLVPRLTKALQEAIAKIETLESKVAALEAAN